MKNKNLTALFAPGAITCTPAALTAMQETGAATGLSLIYKHICGDWGCVSQEQWEINTMVVRGESEEDIVSRYKFLDGAIELVLITSYVHTPSLRWTEIMLPDEIIPHEEYRGVQDKSGSETPTFEDEVEMIAAEETPEADAVEEKETALA